MLNYTNVSDFLITGCAVAPIVALCAGSPAFALFSHIVLLFAGIALAGCDRDAPFRHPERFHRGEAVPIKVEATRPDRNREARRR